MQNQCKQITFIFHLFSYTTGRAVFGRCRIIAVIKPNSVSITELDDLPRLERYIEQFDGVADFFFPMSELLGISGKVSLDQLEVYVEAQVEDPYFADDLSNGSYITTLYDPEIKLNMMSKQPRAFKPNVPYTTYVAVAQQDDTKLPWQRMLNSYIKFRVELDGDSTLSTQTFVPIGPSSIVSYTFTPTSSTRFIAVSATFVENDYEDSDSLVVDRAVRYNSPSNSYIYIASSTQEPKVGDFMIFVVKVSQPVDTVYYHIVSSGRILFTDILVMNR